MRRVTGSLIRAAVVGGAMALPGMHTAIAEAQERQAPASIAPSAPESASEPRGYMAEPDVITRAAIFADRKLGNGELSNGLYVDFANMIPGAGWLSAGPGYRRWYSKDSVFVDGSAAVSWRGYKTINGRLELPKLAHSRLAAGTQFRWQDFTQVSYFGEGPDAPESNRSEYRLRSANLVGYATVRPVGWLGIGAGLGWLKPSIQPRSGSFLRDVRDTRDVFPGDIVFAVPDARFIHSEASMAADTRDFPGHPTRGGLVRVSAARYSDRDAGAFSFKRYETEAAGFVPLADSRVVVAVHGWLVASATSEGQIVPFYLQPSLGGGTTLRGYADYRFHDRNLLVMTAEARIAMMTHVDAAVFVDAGNVAARSGDLDLGKRSYGAGLRLHTRRQTFARLDAARGGEGWRLMFRLTDPLSLARASGKIGAVPFVP